MSLTVATEVFASMCQSAILGRVSTIKAVNVWCVSEYNVVLQHECANYHIHHQIDIRPVPMSNSPFGKGKRRIGCINILYTHALLKIA